MAFLGQEAAGGEPALSGDDIVALAVLPHEKRLQDAEGPNGRHEVRHVPAAVLANIERRDFEV